MSLPLFIPSLLALLTPAAQAQERCRPEVGAASIVGDLHWIVGDWSVEGGPSPGDYDHLTPQELERRVAALHVRAALIAPYADSYVNLVDRVAGYNFNLLGQLADRVAWRSPYQAAPGNPFTQMLPQDWSKIPYDQQQQLRAAAEAVTAQLRQDLRSGQVSAPFDPGAVAGETTPEGVRAVLRLHQVLQQNDIPQNFRGHSPNSVQDVRGLQGLAHGRFPDPKTQPAAFDVVSHDLRERDDSTEVMWSWSQQNFLPQRIREQSLPATLPNAGRVADELDDLAREKAALDAALVKAGLPPTETPVLDATVERLQTLDALIARTGQEIQERLGDRTTEYTIVGGAGESRLERVPTELFRLAPVVGPGSRGYESGTEDGRIVFYLRTAISPVTQTWTPQELDELVRIKDALGLLAGNTSGLSLADIPMSPWVRAKLGLGEGVVTPGFPLQTNFQQDFLEVFQPRRAIEERPQQIDRAALVPAELRGRYLLDLSSRTFRRSLRERSETELTAEFDNTWLNRTVEVVDFPGWIFKGHDPDNWIGPRAARNLNRSQFIGRRVDELTDQLTTEAIYGRYGLAMDHLRQIHGLNNQHDAANLWYEYKHQQTEMETGLFIATLPLSALGAAEGGAHIARRLRNLRSVTRLRGAASAVDDLARVADDLARGVDDLARGADDLARVADDVDGLADDFVHIDDAGFVHRPTHLEDDFVDQFRRAFPDTELDELAIRREFRGHARFDDAGKLRHLEGEEAFLRRQQEVKQLRESDMFRSDLRARGISEERITWMESKQSPLSFESPEQYQKFQQELDDVLRASGLDDGTVSLKGTSTTFYSENPGKPLGHHFDANSLEIADVDLGLTSPKMVDRMQAAGFSPHPKITSIYKTRHVNEVFPELRAFSQRWEGILGREVNFVGLTDRAVPTLTDADFLVRSLAR